MNDTLKIRIFVTNVIVFFLYFGIIVFLTECMMLIRLVVVALTENTKLIQSKA